MKSSESSTSMKKKRTVAAMRQDPKDATASIHFSTQQRKRACIPCFSTEGRRYKEQYQQYLNSLREQTFKYNVVCPDFLEASVATTSSNVEDIRKSKQSSGFLSNEQRDLDILFDEQNCEAQQSVAAYGHIC